MHVVGDTDYLIGVLERKVCRCSVTPLVSLVRHLVFKMSSLLQHQTANLGFDR